MKIERDAGPRHKTTATTHMKHYYEVLWYEGQNEHEALCGSCYTKKYLSRKQALAYYEKHKNDANKFGWWVTERDQDGFILDDLIY